MAIGQPRPRVALKDSSKSTSAGTELRPVGPVSISCGKRHGPKLDYTETDEPGHRAWQLGLGSERRKLGTRRSREEDVKEPKRMSTKKKEVCVPSECLPESIQHRSGTKQPRTE